MWMIQLCYYCLYEGCMDYKLDIYLIYRPHVDQIWFEKEKIYFAFPQL